MPLIKWESFDRIPAKLTRVSIEAQILEDHRRQVGLLSGSIITLGVQWDLEWTVQLIDAQRSNVLGRYIMNNLQWWLDGLLRIKWEGEKEKRMKMCR